MNWHEDYYDPAIEHQPTELEIGRWYRQIQISVSTVTLKFLAWIRELNSSEVECR
jgi:hypothetical protein